MKGHLAPQAFSSPNTLQVDVIFAYNAFFHSRHPLLELI
jgi:hypothetical protein